MTKANDNQMPVEQWLAIRKAEALKIDPKTAEVEWGWGYVLDPYGVKDLPPEARCIGREYWARRPDSDIWVSFDDLPEETCEALQPRCVRFPNL